MQITRIARIYFQNTELSHAESAENEKGMQIAQIMQIYFQNTELSHAESAESADLFFEHG